MRLVICIQHYTETFSENRWAIHYYTPIEGHKLVTRRDLFPSELDHPRAGQWYYKLQLGPLEHKMRPSSAPAGGASPSSSPRATAL
jgi:hypothetical protein